MTTAYTVKYKLSSLATVSFTTCLELVFAALYHFLPPLLRMSLALTTQFESALPFPERNMYFYLFMCLVF